MRTLSRYNFYMQSLADILAIICAFFLSFLLKFGVLFVRGGFLWDTYIMLLLVAIISYLLVDFVFISNEPMTGRTLGTEIRSVLAMDVEVTFIVFFYLFFAKQSETYSRVFLSYWIVLLFILSLLFRRVLYGRILPNLERAKSTDRMVMVGSEKDIRRHIDVIRSSEDWRIQLTGLVVTDHDMTGSYIEQIPVIAGVEDMLDVISRSETDAVLIIDDRTSQKVGEWVLAFNEMGKTTHVTTAEYESLRGIIRSFDSIGDCEVMSFLPVRKMSRRKEVLKRAIDLVIALVMLPLIGLFSLLSLLFINLESPGPLFMPRIRVGRNGRRFDQLRFRVLRMDADERLAAGRSPYTRWGRILNALYLDRLPLFLNVLFSDMSLVGPHAPTFHRFMEYGSERRKNLCVRPGIIGRWCFQAEEEDIIRQERSYIEDWSFLQDIAIFIEMLIRLIARALPRDSREDGLAEEAAAIREYRKSNEPLVYDHWYTAPRVSAYGFFKRLLDMVLSALAIILLSPLFLILIIVISVTDGGNPIYGHDRIGLDGRRIRIWKFRTMRRDAGDLRKLLTPAQIEQYRKEFKIEDDPRITRIGRFLRSTSLDELPQLFNVLGGSLSFVGPRPIVEEETEVYGRDIARLLSVKPGLTGYWQVYARNHATYASGERQRMELYYVDHRSLGLDILIIFKTFGAVLRGSGE